jgi:hypothetical protein
MKQVYSLYKYLHFPIYDYINLGLLLGAYKLSQDLEKLSERKSLGEKSSGEFLSPIQSLNLKDSSISICVEKNFSLRYSMISEKMRVVYETGKSEIGVLLCMEWIRSFNCDVYTIFDIDECDLSHSSEKDISLSKCDLSHSSEKDLSQSLSDFLLPFTTLWNLQKGFLIINSEVGSEISETGKEPFDFCVYNELSSIWNNKEYIPKRKKLSEPLPEFQIFRESDTNKSENHISENRKPIFIIDSYESILQWIRDLEQNSEILSNSIFVYVGKRKNIKI